MKSKFKPIAFINTYKEKQVIGVMLHECEGAFAVDLRVFEKSDGDLEATPTGIILPANAILEAARALALAHEAARMWSFLAADESAESAKRSGTRKIHKKSSDGVVLDFPGNDKPPRLMN